MQPLITIGIASYNYEVNILKALKAIKRQKFIDYEIIISDDCSVDNSVSVIKKFMLDNPQINITLIESKKNEGIAANKNKIIDKCNGKYLMICDADDWMDDECLEKIANVIYKEEPDRVLVEIIHIDEKGRVIQIEHLPEHQTKWGWTLFHGSVFKVSILKEYEIKIKEDFDDVDFTLEFTKHCEKLALVKKPLYYWLVHPDSAGRSLSKNQLQNIDDLFYYIGNVIKFVKDRNDGNAKNDIEELRLVLLKFYYCMLLFYCQSFSLKNKIRFYNKLKKTMIKVDKDYLKNDYLSKKDHLPLRPYAMNVIKLCARLEKFHLMPFALAGYHIVSKFKYFDQ